MSRTPKDIANRCLTPDQLHSSAVLDSAQSTLRKFVQQMDDYISDPLCPTRKGSINPLYETKKQLPQAMETQAWIKLQHNGSS